MKWNELESSARNDLFEYLLRLGDDRIVVGHRLAEWCGHGPILEEDVALTNLSLDCIGHATNFLHLAGEIEGRGRDEDTLAYQRDEREYRNCVLLELPRGDFAFTILRHLFFSLYSHLLFEGLTRSSCEELAAIATKCAKEVRYHVRHASEWVIRLGDGTPESKRRLESALSELWRHAQALFISDELEQRLVRHHLAVDSAALRGPWRDHLTKVFAAATIALPPDQPLPLLDGRKGIHSEHLGHMLAEMQSLPRAHPGARW